MKNKFSLLMVSASFCLLMPIQSFAYYVVYACGPTVSADQEDGLLKLNEEAKYIVVSSNADNSVHKRVSDSTGKLMALGVQRTYIHRFEESSTYSRKANVINSTHAADLPIASGQSRSVIKVGGAEKYTINVEQDSGSMERQVCEAFFTWP